MAIMNKIDVQACDNELIILASTAAQSSELCRLKSGYNAPVSDVFNLTAGLRYTSDKRTTHRKHALRYDVRRQLYQLLGVDVGAVDGLHATPR